MKLYFVRVSKCVQTVHGLRREYQIPVKRYSQRNVNIPDNYIRPTAYTFIRRYKPLVIHIIKTNFKYLPMLFTNFYNYILEPFENMYLVLNHRFLNSEFQMTNELSFQILKFIPKISNKIMIPKPADSGFLIVVAETPRADIWPN